MVPNSVIFFQKWLKYLHSKIVFLQYLGDNMTKKDFLEKAQKTIDKHMIMHFGQVVLYSVNEKGKAL